MKKLHVLDISRRLILQSLWLGTQGFVALFESAEWNVEWDIVAYVSSV